MAEEDKTKVADEKNTKEVKDDKAITLAKDDKGIPEWLTPILSALGGMGGSYMLFIKPLQERMDMLANQVIELRGEVKELRHQNKELEKSLGNMEKNQNNAISQTVNDYLPVKQPIGQVSYIGKRL